MKFGDWWAYMNKEQQELARQALGINASLVSRYSNEHLRPNNKRIQQIYVYSRGAVEPNDWFDMVYDVAGGWLPIETAKRTGPDVKVLMWLAGGFVTGGISVGFVALDGEVWLISDDGEVATHHKSDQVMFWQPRPDDPEFNSTKGEENGK